MKQLAIIRGVHFGNRDIGEPCLWFDTNDGSHIALQVLVGQDALAFVKESRVSDISLLEGKPCWVENDGDIMRLLGLADI